MQFDHASLVTASKALASGYDLRVAYWNGTAWQELDRVLDSGSGWNSSTTTLWFKTQAAIAANSTDNNYFLFYSSAAVVPPPANASNVFLFADDFEVQNFNKWLADSGSLWTIDNTRSHSGSYSAMYPTEGGGSHNLWATPNVNVADVYFEAWWNINALSQKWNVSQQLRVTVNDDGYSSLLCSCSPNNTNPIGWNISKDIGGVYSDINAPAGTISANSWMRVGTAIAGSTYQVFLNGTLVNTATGIDAAHRRRQHRNRQECDAAFFHSAGRRVGRRRDRAAIRDSRAHRVAGERAAGAVAVSCGRAFLETPRRGESIAPPRRVQNT